MSLPKLDHPTFELTLPSTKQSIRFRPFLVREEKMLLVAQASESTSDMIAAIKQVVTNCIVTEGIDVNNFASFDLEYFFLKLRSKSVNNVVELTYRDNEDDQLYSFSIDLDQVEMKFPEVQVPNIIEVQGGYKLRLKYPTAGALEAMSTAATGTDLFYAAIQQCLDVLFNDNEVYQLSEYSNEEVKELIDDLPVNAFNQIRLFAESAPTMYHELSYTNKLGNKRKIVLQSLNDFFTLR